MLEEAAGIDVLSAHYVFFIDLNGESNEQLDATNFSRLCELLDVTELNTDAAGSGDHHFVVVPRLGTISPWSTKATDIVQHCGLTQVSRVERGICWTYKGVEGKAADDLAKLLHDRMIEEGENRHAVIDPFNNWIFPGWRAHVFGSLTYNYICVIDEFIRWYL